MRRRPPILWLLAPLLLVCLLLPGCFTSLLWGKDLDNTSLTSEKTYEHDDHVSLWVKIVLTPLALAFDILTWPLQDLVSDEDDDDDCDCAHHGHHKRR